MLHKIVALAVGNDKIGKLGRWPSWFAPNRPKGRLTMMTIDEACDYVILKVTEDHAFLNVPQAAQAFVLLPSLESRFWSRQAI